MVHLIRGIKPVAKNLISKLIATYFNIFINLKSSLDVFNQYTSKIVTPCFNMGNNETHPDPLCHFGDINKKQSNKNKWRNKMKKTNLTNHVFAKCIYYATFILRL